MREKLRKFRSWMEEGRMNIKDIRTAYDSWRGHMKRGNSWRVLRQMERYYNRLIGGTECTKSERKARCWR